MNADFQDLKEYIRKNYLGTKREINLRLSAEICVLLKCFLNKNPVNPVK